MHRNKEIFSEVLQLSKHTEKNVRDRLLASFAAANEHRDYSIYTRLMDAALLAKAQAIFPHFGDIGEGSVIVDAGSGTGQLAELAAREFRGAEVFALDISHELLERADHGKALTHLVYGDARDQNFPDNSVDVKFFSTSGHEIETFGGPGSMLRALKNSFRENLYSGRTLVRDFIKPSITEPVYMEILSHVGVSSIPDGTPVGDIDYSVLSTACLFDRFHKEFQGGNAFTYEVLERDGKTLIKLPAEWAYEFYMRKDYTANWRQEIKEKYCYWTAEEGIANMEAAGFENVYVATERNEYIYNNRLKGKIALYKEEADQLVEIDIPPTHMLLVGQKLVHTATEENLNPALYLLPELYEEFYEDLLRTIHIDREQGKVKVGNQEFLISDQGITGTKKHIFRLKDQPGKVLKIVRQDTFNTHSAFRSMYQIIERQQILEQYNTPHMRVLEQDGASPPFRYLIQEEVPKGAVCAADLIRTGSLTETDIQQMAEIINTYEKTKEWQLDTNPFSWYRVTKNEEEKTVTQMVYVSSKVYRYDEYWTFKKVGLLQWLNPVYVENARNYAAAIPSTQEFEKLKQEWSNSEGNAVLWKKYLAPEVQP